MPTSPRPIADIGRELGLAAEEWLRAVCYTF
jgi:hypothetical protein